MDTKILDLRGLSENTRDHEIRQTICTQIAKLENPHWIDHCYVYGGKYPNVSSVPDYATSPNEVLPLLEKQKHWSIWKAERSGALVWVWYSFIETDEINAEVHHGNATASTFSLAACLALLRANGIEVLV